MHVVEQVQKSYRRSFVLQYGATARRRWKQRRGRVSTVSAVNTRLSLFSLNKVHKPCTGVKVSVYVLYVLEEK